MAPLRIKVVVTAVALYTTTGVCALSLENCAAKEDPAERLDCYDEVVGREKLKPNELTENKSFTSSRATSEPNGKTNIERTVFRGVIKDELPRKKESIAQRERDRVASYTIARVIRKYDGKIEYLTTTGRRFRQISSTPRTFKTGDVLVAKLGVFESVFLINEEGKRVKVKVLN